VQTPTLVMCGTRDRANVPAARMLAAAIPDATLRLVPRAGHLWNFRQPQQFSEILGSFLTLLSDAAA
jgi:3-oxoadipate enol-lactonase